MRRRAAILNWSFIKKDNDDVLIMADPYDTPDHYQDGYYAVPLGRFYYMWREGSGGETHDPYVQPFVVAEP